MSPFVVSNTTINRIVSYLADSEPRLDRYAATERRALNEARQLIGGRPGPAFAADLGRALWQLNVAAVWRRYPANPPIPDDLYRYEYCPHVEVVQVVKHLSCLIYLIYQCSEGDVPEHPLYQWLIDLRHALALDIVERSADYYAADWDAA